MRQSYGCQDSPGARQALQPLGYETFFTGAPENPLSRNGRFSNIGLLWTNVIQSGGLAFGTMTGAPVPPYVDSWALLSGWPPNHYAEANIHIASGITAAHMEVEILLRAQQAPNYMICYECNLAFDGSYGTITKWPGPLGTNVSQYTEFVINPSPWGAPQEGDLLSAEIVGATITSWITRGGERRLLCTATDPDPLLEGSPGVGFYADGGPSTDKFSFPRFKALAR